MPRLTDFKDYLKESGEIGYVDEVVSSIAYVNGIPGVKPNEIIVFESGNFGQAVSIKSDRVEVLLFSNHFVKVGEKVTRTKQELAVPVGDFMQGLTVDSLGEAIDTANTASWTKGSKPVEMRPVMNEASGIVGRKKIARDLKTGVAIVDMMVPLGKGQRELVIGDRKTGKSNFLLLTILTQAKLGTLCVYAAIGKKKLDIKKTQEFFEKNKILKNTIIVASSSQDPAGKIFLTPYTAMTIAEYFKDQGKDVLVVLDDLSTHAKFYREISLLGKKFPGRNSYPGDMFYMHARLLERSGNFMVKDKESSITCLPVVETAQGDLSGYIQTNVMSMTDGHIYFDLNLFSQGRRPSVNAALSVTRVGRQTQTQTGKEINRELTSFLSLYEKMQSYMHFGAELNESVKQILSTGEKIIEFFDQPSDRAMPGNLQIFLFCLLWRDSWQGKSSWEMKLDMEKIYQGYVLNPTFKEEIDRMVGLSKSFNGLLEQVTATSRMLLATLDLSINQTQTITQTPAPVVAPTTKTQQQKQK